LRLIRLSLAALVAFTLLGARERVIPTAPTPCLGVAEVNDLPLVEVRSATRGDTMAILVTGDGGWRALDKEVAAELARDGVDVVGLLSPDYFRTRRTPAEAACALDRIIRHYSIDWHKRHVVLVGYSRGVGVLPFMVSRLEKKEKAEVAVAALISLDPSIAFKYTPRDLFRQASSEHEIPVEPEIEKLGLPVLCVYGVGDSDALCPTLPRRIATAIPEPGGHHPGGDYRALVHQILTAAR